MFTISDNRLKLSFSEMEVGTYFEMDDKVYRKVQWEGEACYALECGDAILSTVQDIPYYVIAMDDHVEIKFSYVTT